MRWVREPLDDVPMEWSRAAIEEAGQRIAGNVHRSPIMTSTWLDHEHGCRFFFKCENLQRGGAFKIRGAMNAVMQLQEAEAQKGVVTHSSGNHAQALAIASAARKIPCTVVMPSNAPAVKRQATLDYGANVITCEPNLESRVSTTEAFIQETGATMIHPYDMFPIIQGQATCAQELLEDCGDLDWIGAPIGGGGSWRGPACQQTIFLRAVS